MKENDWLVASLNNPDFTAQDFKDVSGMNLDNTLFLSKEEYKKKDYIRKQKIFLDKNGNFSEQRFDNYYNGIASTFRDFSAESAVDNYEYDPFDVTRPASGRIKRINFNLDTVNNPDHIRIGVGGINAITSSNKSRRELAQDSKIFDPATGTFLDKSVNDISLFSNPLDYISSLFDDPLVYATYDEDTVEIDPITGNKVKHLKGEWKLNDQGEYYTEKANGRNLRGKTVVSASDYLTNEHSTLNKYDFMDSDDLDKSVAGTIAKNVAAVIPMFIPYVNTVYSGLLTARELAKSVPMAYGMLASLSGDKNPNSTLANTLEAYGQKFTSSSSDYAQENTFAFENFGSLMSDVATQWGQLKFIANAYNRLRGGGEAVMKSATAKASYDYMNKANLYILQNLEGKLSKAQLTSYLGTDKPFDVGKLIQSGEWAETALGKAALNKYLPAAQKVMETRNRLAQDLSLGYMALISNTDVYLSILEKGGTPGEAAAIAFGSTLGMFSVDKYLGLGEMFFDKDPAKIALRKTAKENAALYMAGRTAEAVDTTTKKGIIGLIQKGSSIGKNIIDKFSDKYKDGALGLVGKAIGEGVEEVSEELVTDLTKNLGELAGKLGYFSQTDYGAWEDMGDRYLMSFLGGAAGGGMFGAVEAWNNRNNTTKDLQNDLTYLLRLGKKDDILKEFLNLKKKGALGSVNLSYDNVTNSDGTKTFLTADSEHKSQADSNYEGLVNIVNLLDTILNGNKLNLSEDELFDKMVQGEYRATALSDFLKGDNVETLKDISYISRFQDDFNNLSNKIINVENEIRQTIEDTTDEKARHNAEYKEKLEKLKQEKEQLLAEKDYLFGEGSLGYVEKTLFAMDTALSGRFLALNINQFAREMTGKSIQQLTPAELKTVQSKYAEWKGSAKDDVDKAFNLYKSMEKLLLPELKTILDTDFGKELETLKKLRENHPSKNLLTINDKLDTETDEEFAALAGKLEGETDADYQARLKKHSDAINKYNLEKLLEWIQEYAKNPITSTDFRYFSNRIGALRSELLNYYLDEFAQKNEDGTKSYFWELKKSEDSDEFEEGLLTKQNSDIKDLITKLGTKNPTLLKDKITNIVKDTAQQIVSHRMQENHINVGSFFEDPTTISDLESLNSKSAEELRDLGISEDYVFDPSSKKITMQDLDAYVKAFMGNDVGTAQMILGLTEETMGDYASYLLNPDSELKDLVVSISKELYDKYIEEQLNVLSEPILKNLGKFLNAYNDAPQVKTLNKIESAGFVNNPVIPLLNKISKFSKNSNVDIEDFLKDIYNIYTSAEKSSDFLLSDQQLKVLKLVLEDFKIAEAFIYGATVKETDSTPVGHNKSLNDFVRNHKDVFKNAKELPEISEEDANMLIGEINSYTNEINGWIDRHNLNTGLREIKFIKTEAALTKTIRQFFELNRVAFKISPTVDLLEGFEDLTLDDSLSTIVVLLELIYNNAHIHKLSVSLVLDALGGKVFDIDTAAKQSNANINEELTYDKFTDYDKFQLIVSSMLSSNINYYKNLKSYLETNEKLAPISMLEYASKITYTLLQNPKKINEALDWLKSKSESDLLVAYNTTIVEGIGGSGKTFAVAKLNLGTGKDTWVSGPTKNLLDNLKKSLPDSNEKSKEALFKEIFGDTKVDINKLFTINSDRLNITLKEDIPLQKIENPPKNLLIDEITHFNTVELLLIANFCKLNNINLIALGDLHLNGFFNKKTNLLNIESYMLLAWRTPSLSLSLRNGNVIKVNNLKPLVDLIDKIMLSDTKTIGDVLYKKYFKNLSLNYFNKDAFSGELIIDSIPDEILTKIPKDATVGFVGDPSSDAYKKLVDAGLNVSDPISPTEVLGREFDYVVVDKTWEFTLEKSWNNNNLNMLLFVKDLYTMISRSTKGTILIDNGLSRLVSCKESEANGMYDGLEKSVLNFREKRLSLIEKAISDNEHLLMTFEEVEDDSGGDIPPKDIVIGDEPITPDDIKEEDNPIKGGDNEDEVDISEEDDVVLNNIDVPVIAFSSVHYSGINTASDVWVNDNNSTSDLGIFVKPGEEVNRNKKELMSKLIKLKDIFLYGTDYYNRLDLETKRLFEKEAFDDVEYYVKVEDESNSNRLIGLSKEVGLNNDKRTIRGKVFTIIAKIKGTDGTTYSVSLGGLNNPDTWKSNTPKIKSAIKKLIDSGDASEKLIKLYDNYDNTISKYDSTITTWAETNQEIRINPPKFSKSTRLSKLLKSIRLENLGNGYDYNNIAPMLVMSDVYILSEEIPGVSKKLVGKPVVFLSSNLLLNASELKDLYIEQRKAHKAGDPMEVRMAVCDNLGVSFESLYLKDWLELYHKKVGNIEFTTPMELQPFAIRMYKSMWNHRADLARFLDRYDKFLKDNDLTEELVENICKQERDLFLKYRETTGKKNLSEAEFRKLVEKDDANLASKLNVVWKFNDDIGTYVKKHRLSYSSEHGAYIRKLTNIDSTFYDDPEHALGIYINPAIAKLQFNVLNNIFKSIIDEIVPPIETEIKTYITTDFKKWTDSEGSNVGKWFLNLKNTNNVNLTFMDDSKTNSLTLHIDDKSKLTALPILMMKAAHYMSILMARGKSEFTESLIELLNEGFDTPYILNYTENVDGKEQKKYLKWMSILDPIEEEIPTTKEGEFNSTIPGVIPYNKAANTGTFDSRIKDLFNLMFHGLVSTEKRNDFTGNEMRATASEFKYGIFSDPIMAKKTTDAGETFVQTVTNKSLFALNVYAQSAYIAIDIKPYEEKKDAPNPSPKPKPKPVIETESLKLHKTLKEQLENAGIVIDNIPDNIEDYKNVVNNAIINNQDTYCSSNSKSFTFEDVLLFNKETGSLTELKDLPEFKSLEYDHEESKRGGKIIYFKDGTLYNIWFDIGTNTLKYIKTERAVITPKSIEVETAVSNIMTPISKCFENIEDYLDVPEDLELADIINKIKANLNSIGWDTYKASINKTLGYIKSIKEDMEINDVDSTDLAKVDALIEELSSLVKGCVL